MPFRRSYRDALTGNRTTTKPAVRPQLIACNKSCRCRLQATSLLFNKTSKLPSNPLSVPQPRQPLPSQRQHHPPRTTKLIAHQLFAWQQLERSKRNPPARQPQPSLSWQTTLPNYFNGKRERRKSVRASTGRRSLQCSKHGSSTRSPRMYMDTGLSNPPSTVK